MIRSTITCYSYDMLSDAWPRAQASPSSVGWGCAVRRAALIWEATRSAAFSLATFRRGVRSK